MKKSEKIMIFFVTKCCTLSRNVYNQIIGNANRGVKPMMKWRRHGAGNYSTECGLFNLHRCEDNGSVWWNLYCSDASMTIDGIAGGAVDSFNTKWQGQEAAAHVKALLVKGAA